jgi:hypothetical protein
MSHLARPVSRVRAAATLALTGLLVTSLAACSSDRTTGPEKGESSGGGVVATSGSIAGTVTLSPGVPGSLANARVAIYASVADRQFDRLVKQTAVTGAAPNHTFAITDVAPGTYYLDVCYLPVSATSCRNPSPDNPITVIAGRATPVTLQLSR